MSSLRNAVQRRNHKERAQPLERQKWGLLEKHKDYSLRAKDHNEKKKRLRTLRQKAAERNPDEFAFGMMSSTTKNGVRIQTRGAENGTGSALAPDVVKLLKTQDAGYLTTILQQTKREREKLREHVGLIEKGVTTALPGADGDRRKTFDEDGNEVVQLSLLRDESSDEEEQAGIRLSKEEKALRKKRRRTVQVLHRRIDGLDDQEKKLSAALEAAQVQRAKMKGTLGGENRNGTKFKVRERKR